MRESEPLAVESRQPNVTIPIQYFRFPISPQSINQSEINDITHGGPLAVQAPVEGDTKMSERDQDTHAHGNLNRESQGSAANTLGMRKKQKALLSWKLQFGLRERKGKENACFISDAKVVIDCLKSNNNQLCWYNMSILNDCKSVLESFKFSKFEFLNRSFTYLADIAPKHGRRNRVNGEWFGSIPYFLTEHL
ncbi:uncharacterized protein LOC113346677 [Papaver somniferum]|uniref:uncharacterized protein LOC113346677 n=1 Tax=Papaver somniferum TaxID=3469 RepID=UPI000E700CA3|nr:uncharacterized protein LOC113346677 [Papaver somniferum]